MAIRELSEVEQLDEADVEPALDTMVEQQPPSSPGSAVPGAEAALDASAASDALAPPGAAAPTGAADVSVSAADGTAPDGASAAGAAGASVSAADGTAPDGTAPGAADASVSAADGTAPDGASAAGAAGASVSAADGDSPAAGGSPDGAQAAALALAAASGAPGEVSAPGEDPAARVDAPALPHVSGADEAGAAVSEDATLGVVIPDDAVPQGPLEIATAPKSALMAMRIISIGEPEAPPEAPTPPDEEELSDDDLAPDSGQFASAEPDAPSSLPKPPPPPRSKRPPPPRMATEKERAVKEAAQKRKVRPWWEEVFGDDYSRASFTPTPRQIAKEVDFIESSLGVQAGGVVLDLACGSGEHAVELASRGYAVVGYDLSISQLAQAQEVAQERNQKLNFLQGDMREMAFDETFDAVYCWGSSFGYFEEEKNLHVAQRMLKALRPGGTLLLEVANRDYVAVQTPSSVWFEGDGCLCMDDAHLDWITSRLKVKRAVMLDDGRSKEWNYSMRLYSLHELGKLLHDVGFVVRSASGHPATPGVFFGPASPSLIVLAQRPA